MAMAVPAVLLAAALLWLSAGPWRTIHFILRHHTVVIHVALFEQREPLIGELVEVDVTVGVPVEGRRNGGALGTTRVVQGACLGGVQNAVVIEIVFRKFGMKRTIEF